RPEDAAVARVAALLAAARRPAIVAGRGAVVAGAGPALRLGGRRRGAGPAAAAVGDGVFAGGPYGLGGSCGLAPPTAARLLQDADVVLAVGASLNSWTTRHGTLFASDATVVQVDLDEEAIGAHRRVDLGLVGDARVTAEALVAALADA